MARIAERMRQREREQDRAPARPATQPEPLPETVAPVAPASAKEQYALSHDSPDDTLGVELDQVYARLAADEHAADASSKPDEDEPHGP